ncbi:hypothetical protein AgCh_010459 [Apium graveolens]
MRVFQLGLEINLGSSSHTGSGLHLSNTFEQWIQGFQGFIYCFKVGASSTSSSEETSDDDDATQEVFDWPSVLLDSIHASASTEDIQKDLSPLVKQLEPGKNESGALIPFMAVDIYKVEQMDQQGHGQPPGMGVGGSAQMEYGVPTYQANLMGSTPPDTKVLESHRGEQKEDTSKEQHRRNHHKDRYI